MPPITFSLPTTASPDQPVSLDQHRGKLVLLLGESQQTQAINRAFHERIAREALADSALNDAVRVVPVVNLKVVPKLMQPMVLGLCKTAAQTIGFPVWLDWDGSVSAALKFTPETPYTVLLDRDGNSVWGWRGPVTGPRVEELLAKVRGLLAPPPAPEGAPVPHGS